MTNCFVHMIEFEQGGGGLNSGLWAPRYTQSHKGMYVHMIGAGVEDYPGTLQTHSRYN